MQKAEQVIGRPIEEYLEEQYRTRTQQQIADDLTAQGLRISQASVQQWMTACGIDTRLAGQRPPEAATA
jgi:arginine repressor